MFRNNTYGVEIECYCPSNANIIANLINKLADVGISAINNIDDYNHNDSTDHWKIVEDSSIHGRNPFELVSPILQGEEGFETIKKVCAVLHALRCKVNNSCGMHVHHSIDDIKLSQIKKLFLEYQLNEDVIDTLFPQSRRGANNWVIDSLRRTSFTQWTNILDDDGSGVNRYYKINYQSVVRHGTLEFRQHSGTTNATKIINWIKLSQELLFTANPSRVSCLQEFLDKYDVDNPDWYIARAQALA